MEFFKLVLIASGVSSIMAMMIFLVKLLFKNKLGVKWSYCIWFLLLLRLIIPPNLIESPLSVFNVVPGEIHNKISLTEKFVRSNDFSHGGRYNEGEGLQKGDRNNIENNEGDISSSIPSIENKAKIWSNPITMMKNNRNRLFKLTYILWGIGVIVLTAYTLYANINLYFKIKKTPVLKDKRLDQILSRCKEKMNINKRVTLIITNEVRSAAIFGLLSPKLLLPKQVISRLSDNEVKHIMLHELSHLKRKDITIKWILSALQIIHWFNPIIWYSFYKMEQDCEVACDATGLSYIETKDHKEYGFTIIRLVELSSQPNWTLGVMSVAGNKSNIKRRIKMINLFKKNSLKQTVIGVVSFATIACVGLTSSQQLVHAIEGSQINNKTLINEENEEFILDDNSKRFISLDRGKDFVDFEFKVPDAIPSDFTFERMFFDKDDNIIRMMFEKDVVTEQGYQSEGIELLISNKDILQYLNPANQNRADVDIEFVVEPMDIDNTKGSSVTIKRTQALNKNKLNSLILKNKNLRFKKGFVRDTLTRYYVWQNEGIWYSMNYYHKSTDLEIYHFLKDSSIDNISENDIKEIIDGEYDRENYYSNFSNDDIQTLVSSLKYPHEIQNINYVSNRYKDLLSIYGNKDLKKAEEILGFKPKFPLALPGGFTLDSSLTGSFIYEGQDEMSHALYTLFQLKDHNDSTQNIEFTQRKNTYQYDLIESQGYLEAKNKKIKVDSKIIDNVKVFTYSKVCYLDSGSNETTIKEYYMWKQDDIIYEAEFAEEIHNQTEIVKELIKKTR